MKRGDHIYLQPAEDGALKVIPENLKLREPTDRTTILNADLCIKEGMLKRIIMENYTLGVDLIKVVSSGRLSGGMSPRFWRQFEASWE